MESSIRTVCTYSGLLPAFKLYNSDLQIMPLISDHLRFMGSVDMEVFSNKIIGRGRFNS